MLTPEDRLALYYAAGCKISLSFSKQLINLTCSHSTCPGQFKFGNLHTDSGRANNEMDSSRGGNNNKGGDEGDNHGDGGSNFNLIVTE